LTEDDLTKAQELFRVRKRVAKSLEIARLGTSRRIKVAGLQITFETAQPISFDDKPSEHGRVELDKEDYAAVFKVAADVLAERLKDIDATLRAFGCEPPKGTSAAMAKLRS
jgi:hypothetical protein